MRDIHIDPIPALTDNYIWAIHDGATAVIVDAGEAAPVLAYLEKNKLTLSTILVTHHHDDHIAGVAQLKVAYPKTQIYAHTSHGLNHLNPTSVDEGSVLSVLGRQVRVWQTFGHTDSHLSYLLEDEKTHVFCGDTLFRAGCGRVFTGTVDELYDSFVRYDGLAAQTLFYPAHEYTLSNLAFAKDAMPDNEAIAQALKADTKKREDGLPTLPTSLADERAINPFLRAVAGETVLFDYVKEKGEPADTHRALFSALRTLKNTF